MPDRLRARSSVRTAVVWDVLEATLGRLAARPQGVGGGSAAGVLDVARRRRRHRGVRGAGCRAGPPGHRRRPQPGLRWPRWSAGPRRRASPTGSAACRATPAGTARPGRPGQRRPGAVPRRARVRRRRARPRWPPSPDACDPAGGSACSSPTATRSCSPGRSPGISPRPTTRSPIRTAAGAPATRCRAGSTDAEAVGLLERGRPAQSTRCTAYAIFADLVPGALVDAEPGAARGAARTGSCRGGAAGVPRRRDPAARARRPAPEGPPLMPAPDAAR